ncbi:MAG: hypothetical protein JNG85_01240, partial [Spirochaetaceae bacterium]|nr:hypothetical protein [Spirochaetaceae bacterium]
MDSHRRSSLGALVAPALLVLASAAGALGAFGLLPAAAMAAAAGILALAAAFLAASALLRARRLFSSLESLSGGAGSVDESLVDLARLVDASSLHGKVESLQGLDRLLGFVNDDLALLQRSAT